MSPNTAAVFADQLEAEIAHETYTVLPNGRTTICQLTLKNGYSVEGSSSCVNIANFNKELGEKYSRERAVREIWPLLGFRLADKQYAEANQGDWRFRLGVEIDELDTRAKKLAAFLATDTYAALSDDDAKADLATQLQLQRDLLEVLKRRYNR